jgi:type III restriction enzyme
LVEQIEISSPHIRQYLHDKNIFLANTYLFKTPQSAVLVTHKPEREFVLKLIDHSKLIEGWIKSPDTGFYSLQYEFWKKGKDKVKRSFNPDFIIKTSVDKYYSNIQNDAAKKKIRKMEEDGLEDIIFVVEIKGKDDYKDETVAKERDGALHFDSINRSLNGKGLSPFNPTNLDQEFRDSYRQHYVFDVLRIEDFSSWFKRFEEGTLVLEK